MATAERDATYTMGRSEGETERLIEQSHLYEKMTLRMLRDAGVGAGMKVLDVGSGAGDVAFAAAQLVGPEGSVTGVDVNPEILDTARSRAEQAGHAQVEFIAGDARTVDLPDDFDAVIGRLVLMYLADPAEALKSFAERVRPGGIVAFQEAEMTLYETIAHPDTPVVNKLVEWGLAVFRQSGANIGMGLELQGAFAAAGLTSPVANLEAPAGGGPDWAGYQYLQQGFASLLPLIESFGIATAEEVAVETLAERLRREAAASGRLIVLPPHVTAYTRVPA